MSLIENFRPHEAFQSACGCASWYLNQARMKHENLSSVQNFAWLRTTQQQPLYEHLSFRCGSTLYFVFVDTEMFPYSALNQGFKQKFLDICISAKAVPCYISMHFLENGEFEPELGGWGLRHFVTQEEIDPAASYTEELVELSDWEVRDIAIRYLVQYIENGGFKVSTCQSYLGFDPSIWVEDNGGLSWILVRTGRGNSIFNELPENVEEIAESVKKSDFPVISGSFTSVNVWDPNDTDDPARVYRCRPVSIAFRIDSDNRYIISEDIPNFGREQ